MIGAIISAGLLAATGTPNVEADALDRITGKWEIVDSQSGEIVTNCASPQSLTLTADRREVVLNDQAIDEPTTYLVVHREENRVLMIIKGEDRLTVMDDPVLWWANFKGADRFNWRRYDWAKDNETVGEWRRCKSTDGTVEEPAE